MLLYAGIFRTNTPGTEVLNLPQSGPVFRNEASFSSNDDEDDNLLFRSLAHNLAFHSGLLINIQVLDLRRVLNALGVEQRFLNKDITKVLVVFPEAWSRSKRQYVRLTSKPTADNKSTSTDWLGHKYDFSHNRNKAKIEYGEDDVRKLETAADSSILRVRSDRGEYKFEKTNGKWVQMVEEI